MTSWYSPEARLLANGWQAPEGIARIIRQKEALLAALAYAAAFRQGMPTVRAAIATEDTGAIIEAISADALGKWADANLQNLTAEVGLWAADLANRMSAAIAADPEAFLASLEGVPHAADVGQWVQAAREYQEHASRFVNVGGGPSRTPPTKRTWEMLSRYPKPLRDWPAEAEAPAEAPEAEAVPTL